MRRFTMLEAVLLLSLASLWGCENDTSNELAGPHGTVPGEKTCLGCHGSPERLQEASDGKDGPAGDVAPLEAWQRVVIMGAYGDAFLASHHGPRYAGEDHHPLACQMCHGGAPDQGFTTMDEAHAGLIPDPSAPGEVACLECHRDEGWTTACDACHAETVQRHATSLHANVWGLRNAVEARCGRDFEAWPREARDGFQADCASCHATCGQCHVSRPGAVGGGFPHDGESLSHRFFARPFANQQCGACHGNVSGDFRGDVAATNEPDVHHAAGLDCGGCHGVGEMHGDGTVYENRFAVAAMPRCETCHAALDENISHIHHAGANPDCGQCHHNGGSECDACHNGGIAFPFRYPLPVGQCQACHAQPYRNCSGCHAEVGDAAATVQFKIARNPNPHRAEYDFAVVRHAPVTPDTYAAWGLELPDYLARPTWTYSAPHSVIRRTPHGQTPGQNCFLNCHGSSAAPSPYLLREADLYEPDGVTPLPDYEANLEFVIPASFPHEPTR